MIKDNLLRILSILIPISIGVYTAVSQGDPKRLIIVLPLGAILIAFVLFLHALGEGEKRINQSLDRRLPPTEHLEMRQDVERETVKLVEHATDFIVATGGRSRNKSYLEVIESKVNSGDVPYWRVIYDEEITHAMCEHMCSVLSKPNVFIRQIKDREYGNMLVVDSGFIVVLPVPGHGGLMGIKVPNPNSARQMHHYVMMLTQDSQAISSANQVKDICEECCKKMTK